MGQELSGDLRRFMNGENMVGREKVGKPRVPDLLHESRSLGGSLQRIERMWIERDIHTALLGNLQKRFQAGTDCFPNILRQAGGIGTFEAQFDARRALGLPEQSLDTTMGMTPLEGLVMGTRSGDVDPGVFEFLHHKEGLSLAELDTMLNKQSGLLGVSGLTSDMRDLLAEEAAYGDRRARLAIDLFCLRARKAIGAMLARMNGADAILFTGGIGENAAGVRARILEGMEWCGVALDPVRNAAMVGGQEGEIGSDDSRMRLFIIPTNEELIIARDAVRCVTGQAAP